MRLTCDDCGAVQDVAVSLTIAGREQYELNGTVRDLLKAAHCHPGKVKDHCARCEEKRLLEAGASK